MIKDYNLLQIQYNYEEHGELASLFDCGVDGLNHYLTKSFAHGDPIFIFIDEDANKIAAYMSLTSSSLIFMEKGKEYQMPAIDIKTFAVDGDYQNLPVSENIKDGVFSDKIFDQVIEKIYDLAENTLNADYITLYSVESAMKFYGRNGFETYKDEMSRFNNRFNEACVAMYMEL